jgi:hypothetical protein
MPRLNYVPSNRALRMAWTAVGVAAMLVFAGLTYAVISTAFQLRTTNERLDQSETQRARLMDQVKRDGVVLSFLDESPTGHDLTYRCRVKVRETAYICRPESNP